jgi:phenylacetate-coenzyme A ligase PaaK-like adenylate-forming protein
VSATESRAWWSTDGPLADQVPDRFALEWHDALRGWRAWRRRAASLDGPDAVERVLARARARAAAYHGVADQLSELPLLGRTDYDADPDRFIAQRRGTRASCHSSGTTGRPITVRYDAAAWFESNHVTLARAVAAVPGLRSWLRPGAPGVVLVTEKDHPRVTLGLPLLDGAVFRRLVVGRSEEEDDALVRSLRSRPPAILHGTPSYLLALLAEDTGRAGQRRIAPGAILVSGETLFDDDRDRLRDWFGCPVLNAYTSAEGGLVGLTCTHGQGLHLPPGCVLEVLNRSGELTSEGAGELVLTNLVNWATMFLRYRTGDRGELTSKSCRCGHRGQTLISLAGREVDAFALGERRVAANLVGATIGGAGVNRFQVIREPRQFIVRWVPGSEEDSAEQGGRLMALLRPLLAPIPVTVEPCARLTLRGGKAWRFRELPFSSPT